MVYIADTFGMEQTKDDDGVTVTTRMVPPDDLKQRRGWFQVDMNDLRKMPADKLAALFDRFVPFHMDVDFASCRNTFYGLHPEFAAIPDGQRDGEYEAVIHCAANTGAYTVEWRPVEGEWQWIVHAPD